MRLIIIEHRLTQKAKSRLSEFGKLIEVRTKGIVYDAISGHPDIFICQAGSELLIAPNTPANVKKALEDNGIRFFTGEETVGAAYPETSHYNAVVTDRNIIHNFRFTDLGIVNTFDNHELIHVNQGYCRCNTLPLNNDHFITSDQGISTVLTRHGFDVLYVPPEGIELTGYPNGFFGGCCGIYQDKVFINGNLDLFVEGEKVRKYLSNLNFEIIELDDAPLMDCGSIIII